MRFNITPLGSSRAASGGAVGRIVNYLAPEGTPDDPAIGRSGPERYYADRGHEPGRWLGTDAARLGLNGPVQRADFARVLDGRDPTTGRRLISAQGSAGRRPQLGVGTETMLSDLGEALYDERDTAAALATDPAETALILDTGTRLAAARLIEWLSGQPPGSATGTVPDSGTAGIDADTARHHSPTERGHAGTPFLVPIIDRDGCRWVSDSELSRFDASRTDGVTGDGVAVSGDPDEILALSEAAAIVGVIPDICAERPASGNETGTRSRPSSKPAVNLARHT